MDVLRLYTILQLIGLSAINGDSFAKAKYAIQSKAKPHYANQYDEREYKPGKKLVAYQYQQPFEYLLENDL
ncbi:MAG: hypothetical protein HC819_17050 [Cyclobacteriaceae bacterium]|nr:hypothetical protein [Cyclobacteriaceae bacterium]